MSTSDQEREPHIKGKDSGEKPDFYLDTEKEIAELDKRIAALSKKEEKLDKQLGDVESSGFPPEAKESAGKAEAASLERIAAQKTELEAKREQTEKVRKMRNKVMIGIGVWTGSASFMLAADRIGKFTGDEKDGLLFDHDERIKLIHDQSKAIHLVSGLLKPFMPGWAKPLIVGGEKVWEATDNINAKYETALKNGEDIGFADSGRWAMEELTGAIKLEDLKDEKKIAQVGKTLKEFAKDFGGTIGGKFEKIGDFIEKNPDKASGVVVKMFEVISKDKKEPDAETEDILKEAGVDLDMAA